MRGHSTVLEASPNVTRRALRHRPGHTRGPQGMVRSSRTRASAIMSLLVHSPHARWPVRTLQDNFDKFTLTLTFMSIFQAIHLIYEALFILLTNDKRR